MDSVRLASAETVLPWAPCSRCAQAHERWDKIVGKSYCPNCEEQLVQGEAEPLVERTEDRACAVCGRRGTVRYLTFPLNSSCPVEMDLCAGHLRALLARALGPPAYHQLYRLLTGLGLKVSDIFLLHEAFYDAQGHALQPAIDW
jgi:hypothetical protein